MKHSIKVLASSIATYLIVAACSGGAFKTTTIGEPSPESDGAVAANNGGAPNVQEDHDGAATSAGGHANSTGGKNAIGAVADAMVNPVADAKADSEPVDGSRLKLYYIAGADGSKVNTFTFRDTVLQVDCMFIPQDDGGQVCIPQVAIGVVFYADAGCSQGLLAVPFQRSPVPAGHSASCVTGEQDSTLVNIGQTNQDPNDCQQDRYYRTGARVSPSSDSLYVVTSAGLCEASHPNLNQNTFYKIGASVPFSSFVKGTMQHD